MRRLPIYIVVDTSESMEGETIEAVNKGIEEFISRLRQDPCILETAYLSVIAFGSNAKQKVSLTGLTSFQMPSVQTSGTTTLGDALSLLANKIDCEVKQTTAEVKGDWNPIVLLITKSNHCCKKEVEELRKRKIDKFITCGIGNTIDDNSLRFFGEFSFRLECINSSIITSFFRWISVFIDIPHAMAIGQEEVIPEMPIGISLIK